MKRLLGFVAVAALLGAPATEPRAQVRDIKWGTAAVGSAGHRALTNLAVVLNREMPNYRFAVVPLPGAILTMKQYALGEIDAYYAADIGFYELANDINRFKGFKAQMKRQPVQSFWLYTVEVGVGIHARDRDRYRQWRDLSGQPVFTGPLPWDVRAHLEKAFATLGVKHRYVNTDLATAGSLLEKGDIKTFITYTKPIPTRRRPRPRGSSRPPWPRTGPS